MPQGRIPGPPFARVADLAEIPRGTGKLVLGPFDKPIALFNAGGELVAINAVCPHRGGPRSSAALSSPAHGMAGPST